MAATPSAAGGAGSCTTEPAPLSARIVRRAATAPITPPDSPSRNDRIAKPRAIAELAAPSTCKSSITERSTINAERAANTADTAISSSATVIPAARVPSIRRAADRIPCGHCR